jgi:hypothetical protein
MEELELIVKDMSISSLVDDVPPSPDIATPESTSLASIGGQSNDETPDDTAEDWPIVPQWLYDTDTQPQSPTAELGRSDATSDDTAEDWPQWPYDTDFQPESPTAELGRSAIERIQSKVDLSWGKREVLSRYRDVIVLLIHWEEHDFGDELATTIDKYKWMFMNLYNYEVRHFQIPSKKPHMALAEELVQLVRSDGPETLFIIWYDGHGDEHPDRRGSPIWGSHADRT